MLYRLIAQLNVHPATLHVQDPTTGYSYTVVLDGEYDPINPPELK
jgi:hypothetical protein